MSADTFRDVAEIAYREAGLVLVEAKSAMVRSRLTRRLRALRLGSFDAYLAYVRGPDGADELQQMISALTTNVSHFFREAHHFDLLRTQVLPPLLARAKAGGRVRIWSAGCSNGQEPYSIAMTILDLAPEAANLDLRILATDIDPGVLTTAAAGRYDGGLTAGLDPQHIAKHFDRTDGDGLQVRAPLRAMVGFRPLNLHQTWPMRGRFDAIFCRNVVIYFDSAAQARLYRKFADVLAPDGWLFIGHSERITEAEQPLFRSAGVTAYRPAGSPTRAKGN